MSDAQAEVKKKEIKKGLKVYISTFLYVFNLRQGTILIAVQHIALSACGLILLLVGIAHAQEMMDMLNADMEDNAEREGTILIDKDDMTLFRDGPVEATNNQQKFKVAQNLAMMMVVFLYGSLISTTVYLMFCVALFYGAAKNKMEYMVPWLFFATFTATVFTITLIIGDRNSNLTRVCGGHLVYRFVSTILVLAHVYCILAVASFIWELKTLHTKYRVETKLKLNPKEKVMEKGDLNIILNPAIVESHMV